MDPRRLIEDYKTLLRTIYSPEEYYRRALECLKRVPAASQPQRRHPIRDLTTLMRVILALGVRDRERSKFWGYMACVAASHRETFARAIILAAMGYHFRKLTEDYCR
jgi:hypothetical protein